MHFCSSLVISVKINHGAISLPPFNHDASCYNWNGQHTAHCPNVSVRFNEIQCWQKLHARWNIQANFVAFRNNSSQRGKKAPGSHLWGGGHCLICLRIRRTTVACAVSLTVSWTVIKAVNSFSFQIMFSRTRSSLVNVRNKKKKKKVQSNFCPPFSQLTFPRRQDAPPWQW